MCRYSKIDAEEAGKYWKTQVIITGADVEFPKPEEIEDRMYEFINKFIHPVAYAAMVHIIFMNIHPFTDGNLRVARLLMNLTLLQS